MTAHGTSILLVSPFFPPQHAVASLRAHSFARTWAENGANVTVLTTQKRPDQRGLPLSCDGFEVTEIDYRTGWLTERARRTDKESAPVAAGIGGGSTVMQGLRRVKAKTGIYSALRMPDLTDRWVEPAIAWCRDRAEQAQPWDVVVTTSGPYTAHLVGRALRQDGRAARWVADFRDLWTDNHIGRGLFPFTVRERQLERACLEEADQIVTVSDGLADQLRVRGADGVTVIYNGYDDAEHARLDPAPVFPRDGRRRLVYTGTVYPPGQDPAPLLRAMAQRRAAGDDSAQLVVVGERGDVWTRAALVAGLPASAIDERGVVPRPEALRLQRDADALISLAWRPGDPRGRGILSGKIFEYLSWTAPILVLGGADDDAIGRLVSECHRGAHIAAGQEDQIAGTLASLGDHGQASPDRAAVERFTRTRQAERLLEVMQSECPPDG